MFLSFDSFFDFFIGFSGNYGNYYSDGFNLEVESCLFGVIMLLYFRYIFFFW